MEIELHIGRLALHGFPAADYESVGAALRLELTRLFTERGIPPALSRSWEIPSVKISSFELTPAVAPEGIGMRVAQAIYECLQVRA
jgi:hypothetical protein